jgi:hypothetical protein
MVIKIPTLTIQGPPKFTQIWNFWFENKPSGNPVEMVNNDPHKG